MALSHIPDDGQEIEIVYNDEEDSSIAKMLTEPDPFGSETVEEVRKLGGLLPKQKRRATRELKKYQQGTDGTPSKQKEYDPPFLTGYNLLEVAEPPFNLEYLAKLYELSSPHFAAVNAKVSNVAGLGFEWKETNRTRELLARIDPENEEKLERSRRKIARAKGELTSWLEDTNEEDTFIETLSRVWTDVETTGNGYLEVGRKVTGEVGYIGHVPSHKVRIRLARDGYVQISKDKVVFFHNLGRSSDPNPLTDDLSPNEIIHFKKYSPTDSYYGIPDILSATNAIAGNEFASRFNLDYFEHKAVPRHLIVVKGARLSGESEAKLIEFFQTGLKGKHHRTMYVPLPATGGDGDDVDFRLEKIEGDVQDASFIKYYNKNRDEILMAHRVPLTKVGLAEGVSLAVARDADKMFKEQVVRPAQDIIEKKLRKLFDEKSDALKFHLKELTLTDEDTMSKIWERYLRMQVVTPNEVRETMGWKGRTGGDQVVPTFQEKPDETAGARDQVAQGRKSRQRDSERSANASDKDGEARNAQGEGRSTT